MNTSDPQSPPPEPESASTHALASDSVRPPKETAWVLVETFNPGPPRWVVAEGAFPRRFSRIARTRAAGSSTAAAHLPALIEQAITSSEPQVRAIYPPSGRGMRVFAVPVIGPDSQVWAVQLWAGPREAAVPLRPEVGAMLWAADGGFVRTTSALERLLDSDSMRSATRTLPDLMRHFERIEDRTGFLRLLGDTSTPRLWSGTAITAGVMSQARLHVSIAACGSGAGRDRTVRALVHDISAAYPVPAPGMTTRLIRAVPIPIQHAVGVVDLRTGLLHEWISQGPPPLDRWLYEIPTIHPEDIPALAALRAELLGGTDHARSHWRIRWEGDSDWTIVAARWTVLTRGKDAPQAMLDLQLSTPRRARPTRRPHLDHSTGTSTGPQPRRSEKAS
ncbi:GAF domain-containing protein [Nocardia abscessus]|uniref:GAF domain-containing protein n=1 Tax=Nocardia abscessus TaxID=120957 RepID=UPI0024587E98|nr:GAF domain-containing protein [Nocardia abscessus]